jgi:hypothetical protein
MRSIGESDDKTNLNHEIGMPVSGNNVNVCYLGLTPKQTPRSTFDDNPPHFPDVVCFVCPLRKWGRG